MEMFFSAPKTLIPNQIPKKCEAHIRLIKKDYNTIVYVNDFSNEKESIFTSLHVDRYSIPSKSLCVLSYTCNQKTRIKFVFGREAGLETFYII